MKRFNEDENVKYVNPYERQKWYDKIVDPTLPPTHPDYVISPGTVHTARRYKHIEDGIYGAYERIVGAEHDHRRLQAKVELGDRTDSDHTFLDLMDGSPVNIAIDKKLGLLKEPTDLLEVGETTLKIDRQPGFRDSTVVTICDGEKTADVLIISQKEQEITVTHVSGDTGEFKKGAAVGRSIVTEDKETELLQPMAVGTLTLHVK